MIRRRRRDTAIPASFPAELLEEASRVPGGWVYEIRPGVDRDGAVPPEAIKGAWTIGPDGRPTGEYTANDKYRSQ